MEEMFANNNPGLARRMQHDRPFLFEARQCFERLTVGSCEVDASAVTCPRSPPASSLRIAALSHHHAVLQDYDDDSLVRIMRKMAGAKGVVLDRDVAIIAVLQLSRARSMPNFGNAGTVKDSLERAIFQMESRLRRAGSSSDVLKLTPEDFGVLTDDPGETAEKALDALVGCDEIRELVGNLRNSIRFAKAIGHDPRTKVAYNYLLLGNPGTGKTTVARLMGRIFHSFGLIPFDTVVEVDASKLQTGYVGQAGKKMTEMLDQAKGKVLFIDEVRRALRRRGSRGRIARSRGAGWRMRRFRRD